MKKIFAIMSLCLIIFGLCACGANNIKQDIFVIVEDNKDIIVDAINTGNYEKAYDIKGIEDITINEEYIVFYCGGKGIAPSSQEYGFYYATGNVPTAIFDGKPVCDFEDLTEKDNGYEYIDNSHNSFYTENITGNFYYYENSF